VEHQWVAEDGVPRAPGEFRYADRNSADLARPSHKMLYPIVWLGTRQHPEPRIVAEKPAPYLTVVTSLLYW
jgi:hypothetical protein